MTEKVKAPKILVSPRQPAIYVMYPKHDAFNKQIFCINDFRRLSTWELDFCLRRYAEFPGLNEIQVSVRLAVAL